MKKTALALNLTAAIAGFAAAYFSFRSAAGDFPPVASYWDAAPTDDPFTQALQAGARENRIAAVLAAIAGAVALAAAISQCRER